MTALPLTWMADAFRENGLRVKEVQGWRTAGRPFTFAPIGVVFHHTASNPARGPAAALGTVTHGRAATATTPALPGPLCNVLVGRDSAVYLVAAGYANHAGSEGPFRTVPLDSGNRYLAGVEVENDGLGEKWTEELLDTCAVVFATFLIGFRRNESWLIGHKEWTTRKPDPAPIDMNAYRRRVRNAIEAISHPRKKAPKPKPKPKPKPRQLDEADRDRIPAGGGLAIARKPSGIYVVVPRDTLWRIAHEHRISVLELMDLNDLTGDLIHVGDELRVPAREREVPPAAASPAIPAETLPIEQPIIDDADGAAEPEVAEDQIY